MPHPHISEALTILQAIGMPPGQQNERSALCFLALLDLTPQKKWKEAKNPLIGITPIMEWVSKHYAYNYAPNSRETFRRFSMHQFLEAGIVLYNPDQPERPVNSPKAVYQIESSFLSLIRCYNSPRWNKALQKYLSINQTLAHKYAKERNTQLIPIKLPNRSKIKLSPGKHNELIKKIIEQFAPRFVPAAKLIYVGDTKSKWGYCNHRFLQKLGVIIDSHGKMPDIVLFCNERKWLVLIEAVTSHGPVDSKRHLELTRLFKESQVGLVYVTAFPDRTIMARYLKEIAWETEVWTADAPSHLIHFNGEKFLGPYRSC